MFDRSGRNKARLGAFVARFASEAEHKNAVGAEEPTMEFHRGDTLESERDATRSVPWPLRLSAALSWRLIVVAIATAGIAWAASKIWTLIISVAIALLLAVLLEPLVRWLTVKAKLPRTLAAALGLLFLVALVAGALSQAGTEIAMQLPDLMRKASGGLDTFRDWLANLPWKIDMTVFDNVVTSAMTQITNYVQQNVQQIFSQAYSVTSSVVSLVSGFLIMLFCLFFFLKEGRTIWLWIVRLFPAPARTPLHESAIRGWVTLGSYVRTQIQVAAIDAVGIGLGAFFLGLPMVLPIIVVVFFASFVPIAGAMVSGAIAVLVALVDQGITAGVIMLVVILVVQQVESNLLQPLLMSHAVSLHPIAVLLVVAGAGSLGGIPGAVFGVPIAAFLNATFLYLHGYDSMPELATKQDRPGGPPGMLDEMVAASYASKTHVNEAPAQSSSQDAASQIVADGSVASTSRREAPVPGEKPDMDGTESAQSMESPGEAR
ncbi:AI-2E family transporter [Schaalia turicensis]|uniref:AI-2E family transporter n=1 Tax=Schaalia turicensis TaxID=131111 RepID=UPI000B25724D|nr:AI-2E family transporter [Schaalia turicensis]QYB16440.1 AI-2E family transporter [Schaalia turicensis]